MIYEPKIGPVSVADQLAFDALPEDTKLMMMRVYGFAPDMGSPPNQSSLEDAFEAGWEACAESFDTPYYSSYEFNAWLQSRRKGA